MSEEPIKPVVDQPAATMNSAPVFVACNTICVKNLNYKTTSFTLKHIFSKFGEIKGLTIKNKMNPNGHPMMFSFITYETEEQATNALNTMNGQIVEGRILTVRYGKKLDGTQPEHKPSIKVKGLDYRTKNDQLKKMFEKYEPIKAEIKLYNQEGRIISKGVGIVELPNEEMVKLAITEMNNSNQNGRTITVEKVGEVTVTQQTTPATTTVTKPKENKEQKVLDKVPSTTKVIVQNLHYKIREEQLKQIFKKYEVVKVIVMVEKTRNGVIKSKGFGFVDFANEEMQQLAIREMNNTEHEGKTITVKPALEKLPPEIVKTPLPMKSYYVNETVTLDVNGQQYKVILKPEVLPGKQFIVEGAGTPINGVKRDLIIELDVEQNATYRREGNNLYHTVYFEKQYNGQTHQLDLTLIDGTPYKTRATVRDGEQIEIMRYGFKVQNGVRGDYFIIIKLQ